MNLDVIGMKMAVSLRLLRAELAESRTDSCKKMGPRKWDGERGGQMSHAPGLPVSREA